jgi:hypothetical protein
MASSNAATSTIRVRLFAALQAKITSLAQSRAKSGLMLNEHIDEPATSCFVTPASSGSKASYRSVLARPTAPAGRGTYQKQESTTSGGEAGRQKRTGDKWSGVQGDVTEENPARSSGYSRSLASSATCRWKVQRSAGAAGRRAVDRFESKNRSARNPDSGPVRQPPEQRRAATVMEGADAIIDPARSSGPRAAHGARDGVGSGAIARGRRHPGRADPHRQGAARRQGERRAARRQLQGAAQPAGPEAPAGAMRRRDGRKALNGDRELKLVRAARRRSAPATRS